MQPQGVLDEYWIRFGPISVSETVVTTWAIMFIIIVTAIIVTYRLKVKPSTLQATVEGILSTIEGAIAAVAPGDAKQLLPFIGSLWIFILAANLAGLIPGVHSPTRDLSTTAGLAFLVFIASHWYGTRCRAFCFPLLPFLRRDRTRCARFKRRSV